MTFYPNRVNQRIDEITTVLEPEIQRHQTKWTSSISNWRQKVQVLKQFANFRLTYLQAHLISKFQLKGVARIKFNIVPPNAGQIKLNSLNLFQFPWQGDYFKEIPIQIEAIPNEGFRLIGWSDSSFGNDPAITFIPAQDVAITAIFDEIEITQVEKNSYPIGQFSLEQNYPNPFNFSTTIHYELLEHSFVTITIFNLNGQTIATLVNRHEQAGRHRVEWNALADREISSGIYFYNDESRFKKWMFY